MEVLNIERTEKTPLVYFSPEEGKFEISGKSIPDDAELFYRPILDWLDQYVASPEQNNVFDVNLDFFNISSSKRLLFILYKLNEIAETGANITLRWHYDENDDDMYEVGQDFAFMVKIPFEFVLKDRMLVVA